MTAPDTRLINALRKAFRAKRDPDVALRQQAYMKSPMPHYGIPAPTLHRIHREVHGTHVIGDAASWQATVAELWRSARFREERHAALALLGARRYRDWLTPDLVPLIDEIVVTGAWWDFIDPIAINDIGYLLREYPRPTTRVLRRWSPDGNTWRRRCAILAQLKFKQDTDTGLLVELIEPSLEETEFFLRKAIGWALREYSKTDPDFVIGYVHRERERLSPLSKREALKVALKKGVVTEVP